MKIGVIGAGTLGSACLMSLATRACAREIVLIDKNQEKAETVANDIQYAASLSSKVLIKAGDYSNLADAVLVIVASDIHEVEKQEHINIAIYKEVIPLIVAIAPMAIILITNDQPDLIADLSRDYAGASRVLSIGTFLDTLRFRFHLSRQFKVNPMYVDAYVIGEYGSSSIFLWSLANIGGVPVNELLQQQGVNEQNFHEEVERHIRCANIIGMDGISAYGMGMAAARIAEIILQDEQVIIPIGSYQEKYGVTLSFPSKLGWTGVSAVYEPHLSIEERCALQKSVDILKQTLLELD